MLTSRYWKFGSCEGMWVWGLWMVLRSLVNVIASVSGGARWLSVLSVAS